MSIFHVGGLSDFLTNVPKWCGFPNIARTTSLNYFRLMKRFLNRRLIASQSVLATPVGSVTMGLITVPNEGMRGARYPPP